MRATRTRSASSPGTGGADNASFTIDGKNLRTAAPFDFETRPTLSIRVRATDSDGLTFEKALTVTVTNVSENPPVAVDDSYTTAEDTTLDRPVSGAGSPAANDTDADGDPLTVTAVSGATGGTASISAGQVHFAPTANLCGAGAGGFDYTVSDGTGGTRRRPRGRRHHLRGGRPDRGGRLRDRGRGLGRDARSPCWPTTRTPTAARSRSPR